MGGVAPNTLHRAQHHCAAPPEIYIVNTCTAVLCMVWAIPAETAGNGKDNV